MEKKTRIQKYEDLRKEMFETKIATDEILEIEEMAVEENIYNPVREKIAEPDFHLEQFNNEYLDEFIKEVKEYNIKKGNAFSEDTQINILKEMVNQVDRDNYIEEIEEVNYFGNLAQQINIPQVNISQDANLSQQIHQLLFEVQENKHQNRNDDYEYQTTYNTDKLDNEILEEEIDSTNTIQSVQYNLNNSIETLNNKYDNFSADFEEHTKQISLKIDEYQESLQTQTKKNFVLNLIVMLLMTIILVTIILGIVYVVYMR